MNTGEVIKLVRTIDGISQRELAKRLDISNVYLSQIETGKKDPSMSLLKTFSEQFSVPLPLLVIGSGSSMEAELVEGLRGILNSFLASRSFILPGEGK